MRDADRSPKRTGAGASYVEDTALGEPSLILSVGFQIRSAGTPTTNLPQPENLVATIGKNAGAVDLRCRAVKRAKSYIWEYREYLAGQPPGPWIQAKIGGRRSVTVTGLISGRQYAFRVRALGPNETESPWSDEAVSMAA